jgi:hypothetical protein
VGAIRLVPDRVLPAGLATGLAGLATGLATWLPAAATSGLRQTGTWFDLGNLPPVGSGALLLTMYAVVVVPAGARISGQRELL